MLLCFKTYFCNCNKIGLLFTQPSSPLWLLVDLIIGWLNLSSHGLMWLNQSETPDHSEWVIKAGTNKLKNGFNSRTALQFLSNSQL